MQSVQTKVRPLPFYCDDFYVPSEAFQPKDLFDPKPTFPRFIFTPTGSITCSISPSRLHCQFTNGRDFSWSLRSSPDLFANLAITPDNKWTIADAAFLDIPSASSPSMLVLLNTPNDGRPQRSLVCLLALNNGDRSRFTRFISLRGRAEAIHVISKESAECKPFDGVVAVAFERGLVSLLDLCLSWSVPERICLEPSVCVSVKQCLETRENGEAISPFSGQYEHSLVHLNYHRISPSNFYYQTHRDETLAKFPAASVNVTLLHYVPQIHGLVTGFSFGGWQIWCLKQFAIIYTFRDLPPVPSPVVSCAFCEPSDDPRFCCFLMLGWQNRRHHHHHEHPEKPNVTSRSPSQYRVRGPKVCLFQMGFRKRQEIIQEKTEDVLYEYDEFYGASRRLFISLAPITASLGTSKGDEPHWAVHGSYLTSIQSLGTNYLVNFGLRSNRLVALVWRAATSIVRIGLFDLDRWYHAQMPSSIRSDNSFFAVYDAALGIHRTYPLTAHVLPQAVVAFWADVYRREVSALGLGGSRTNSKHPLRGYQDLRRPLHESQLRPSAHAFNAVVPFIKGSVIGSAELHFVSRQELALRALTKALDSPADFEAIEWLSEAVTCGLIQEFDDPDCDISQALRDLRNSDWVLRQALGVESPSAELLQQVHDADAEEKEALAESRFHASKRRRKDVEDDGEAVSPFYLPPEWVLIVNCLFEHGRWWEIKHLTTLMEREKFDGVVFLRRWLWLRWLGRKSVLEDLVAPLLEDPEERPRATTEDGLKDLCLCVHSLRGLAEIADCLMSKNGADEAKLRLIQQLEAYTHPICLLLRLGLLPPASTGFGAKATVFAPYDPAEIGDFVAQIGTPVLTERLIDHLRVSLASELGAGAIDPDFLSVYPPRSLRSICALWQCPETPIKTVLTLLVFLLFDAVAVNAMRSRPEEEEEERKTAEPEIHAIGQRVKLSMGGDTAKQAVATPGPVARALKLQEFMERVVVNEFPHFGGHILTARTLWLIDRQRFAEALCSRLSPVAQGEIASFARLPEVLPNQARVVQQLCLRQGQTELAALFAPHQRSDCLDNVLPPLYQARRLYSEQKDPEEAAKVLLQLADSFRKKGALAELIRQGLTSWEANVLFSDMQRRGGSEQSLLFASLVSRAQHKEAVDLYTQITSDPISRLAAQNGRRLHTEGAMKAIAKSIAASLPQLRYQKPFSALLLRNPISDSNQEPSPDREIVPIVSCRVELPPCSSGDRAPAPTGFSTPVGRRLSVQMKTVDRARVREFWDEYAVMQRVLRGEPAFEKRNASPVEPQITESARQLRRKLDIALNSRSIMSPRLKRVSGAVNGVGNSKNASVVVEPVRGPRSDFWSELGEYSRASAATTLSAAPRVSILKTRSALSKHVESDEPALVKDASKSEKEEALKSIEVDGDDAEITINPQTLQLGERRVPVVTTVAATPEMSKTTETVSSARFSFSPPIRTTALSGPVGEVTGSGGGMDVVAQAICAATRQFAFASPATYLARNKFTSSPSVFTEEAEEEEEEEEQTMEGDEEEEFHSSFDYEDSATLGSNLQGASNVETSQETEEWADSGDVGMEEEEAENAAVSLKRDTDREGEEEDDNADDGEGSVATTAAMTNDDEEEEVEGARLELDTPRRSRRQIKKPERYHY